MAEASLRSFAGLRLELVFMDGQSTLAVFEDGRALVIPSGSHAYADPPELVKAKADRRAVELNRMLAERQALRVRAKVTKEKLRMAKAEQRPRVSHPIDVEHPKAKPVKRNPRKAKKR